MTYTFVDDVLGELAALTPGPYLHIGGDEALSTPRRDYARVHEPGAAASSPGTARRSSAGTRSRRPAHAAAAVAAVLGHAHRATDAGRAAPCSRGARWSCRRRTSAYLDMKYTPDTPLGHDWAGLIEVRTAYDWDPGHLPRRRAGRARCSGVEAPLWTETITTRADIEYMAFPRLPAIAELGWSPARDGTTGPRSATGWPAQGPRWAAAGMAFHRSPEIPWPAERPAPAARQAAIPTQTNHPTPTTTHTTLPTQTDPEDAPAPDPSA